SFVTHPGSAVVVSQVSHSDGSPGLACSRSAHDGTGDSKESDLLTAAPEPLGRRAPAVHPARVAEGARKAVSPVTGCRVEGAPRPQPRAALISAFQGVPCGRIASVRPTPQHPLVERAAAVPASCHSGLSLQLKQVLLEVDLIGQV